MYPNSTFEKQSP